MGQRVSIRPEEPAPCGFLHFWNPMNHLADRAADTAALVAAASYAGFFPVDLETWMVVLSATGAGFYYCSKGLLLWWDHFFPSKDDNEPPASN